MAALDNDDDVDDDDGGGAPACGFFLDGDAGAAGGTAGFLTTAAGAGWAASSSLINSTRKDSTEVHTESNVNKKNCIHSLKTSSESNTRTFERGVVGAAAGERQADGAAVERHLALLQRFELVEEPVDGGPMAADLLVQGPEALRALVQVAHRPHLKDEEEKTTKKGQQIIIFKKLIMRYQLELVHLVHRLQLRQRRQVVDVAHGGAKLRLALLKTKTKTQRQPRTNKVLSLGSLRKHPGNG